MLPSTGLFKSINCPFFASDSCSRPFCHFKHSKKDETEPQTPPVYTPSQRTESKGAKEDEPVAKKAKLEYVPHSISTKAVTNDLPAPSYIPNLSVLKTTNPDEISFEQIDEELNLISDILQDVEDNGEEVPEAPVATYTPSKIEETRPEVKDTEKENIEEKSEGKPEKEPLKVVKEEKTKSKEDKKHSSSRHRSSSSKSRHHSSKSSHKTHKSSSKSHDSDRKNSHSSKRHHSSSSRSSSKSSSDKKSGKSSSSHSSKSLKVSSSTNQTISQPPEIDIFALEAESSDEDDIMAQCKMIFEEFQDKPQENAEKPVEKEKKPDTEPPDPYEDASKKKRVAHENAQNRPSLLPAPSKRVNHMQNALQSVYQRQELVRRQLEAAKPVKEEPKIEPPLKSPPESPGNPTVRRTIAPVSNTIALMNAKKRIEELKRQKTIAQTASKAGKRIAHANAAILTDQPAPPVLEATATKISYNLRMQYYNIMVKHCLGIYPNCEDAWQRAQTEELTVFKKCSNPMIYKSSASLTVNKLRKESIEAGNSQTEKNNLVSHDVILAGKSAYNTSWGINKKKRSDSTSNGNTFDSIASSKAYDLAVECALNEDQLKENGFPRSGKWKGHATICKTYQRHHLKPPNPDERYCSRCSKLFNITCYDRLGVDECNYHPKGTGFRRGFADNFHRCCQQTAGTPGCMYGNYHVSHQVDYENLSGFVTTISRDEDYVCTRKDIYAVDCEMCYTTEGLELTRVTVVDVEQKVVYDALVKPDNRIVDYNTTYSGITEAMLAKETRTLRQVQAVLLSMFHARTILVGHSLESDLQALKMIHSTVVDTSVLYPHKMGPPKKRALKTLCIENLKRIIQENESGHDSAEDAEVCIQLLKHYLRNRIS